MRKFLFGFVGSLLFLAGIPYFLYRVMAGKESAASLWHKLGFYGGITRPPLGGIWVHAVSVGEVNTAIPLVQKILVEDPGANVIFTASTATGMGMAESRLEGRVTLAYFPFDFPFAVRSALRFFQPSLFIFFETEIWPNFIYQCHWGGIPAILVNGRISDASYLRYLRAKPLLGEVLSRITLCLMQSADNAERIRSLGARDEAVKVTGNIKFDKPLPSSEKPYLVKEEFRIPFKAPVIIFASTHSGEDEPLLRSFIAMRRSFKNLFCIIAPRHPQRAGEITAICKRLGLQPALRSQDEEPDDLLVLDTIGELGRVYGGTDVAVMGGSFIPHGGQNPLEPAGWGVPVLYGPYMTNFRSICKTLEEAGGAKAVDNPESLETEVTKLLSSYEARKQAGAHAKRAIQNNQGALDRNYEEIKPFLPRSHGDR